MVNWLKLIKQAYINICLQKGYEDLLRQGKPIMVLLTKIYSWIKENIRDPEVENLTLEELYKICEWYDKYENVLRIFIHPKYAGRIETAHIVVSVEPHEINQLLLQQQTTTQQKQVLDKRQLWDIVSRAYAEIVKEKFMELVKRGISIPVSIPELHEKVSRHLRITPRELYELCLRLQEEYPIRVFVHPLHASVAEYSATIIIPLEYIKDLLKEEEKQTNNIEKSIEKEYHKKERKKIKMATTQKQNSRSYEWSWFSLDLLKEAIREVFGVEPRIEVISSNAVRAEFDDYRLCIQCFKECKGCQASLYFKGREVTMCKIKCYDFENNEERAKKVTMVLEKAKVPAEYGLSWSF